ncbi:sulfatase-like hydrolase/transferase [Lederbergia lenta]|uniref:Sulfatase n=1 Tax=Lederbergia lenta TaxID=1467 RepID=A0A2X4VNL9_LEDLE|nr:sulfatase-like hydrolase/transferase [Lederbergia lenta]MEC2325764.1 sulfatase-like hydrolase/transferase [Lederbergia lenta]SQI53787.1 sulfatase [Lederbergia lenta]
MSNKQPNILFILTDQQRVDTLKAYGGEICQTPNIDSLIEESIVFNNAYASCPVCTPARASLQTGLYPHNHEMRNNTSEPGCRYDELPNTQDLLSARLKKQNYSIGYTGKWHLGSGDDNDRSSSKSSPTAVGYEGDNFPGHGAGGHNYPQYAEYLIERGLEVKLENKITGHYKGHWAAEVVSPVETTVEYFLTDRAIHYIDQFRKRPAPFFFQLNFWGPHEPYVAPTKYLDLYRNQSLEPWPNFYDTSTNKPSIHNVKRANSAEWKTFEPYVKHYYANMSLIDDQIGRLLNYLKEHDLYDNTIIIFSADHGESLGIHGGLCDKNFFMYEETCRIPLIIKPQNKRNQMRYEDRFVGTCDIYSSILDWAGVPELEARRDGRSFVPFINDENVIDWPDHAVTEGNGLSELLYTQRMIRHENMKYVFNCGDIDELYDLQTDPYELVNQVENVTYKNTLRSMQELLATWMEKHHDQVLDQYRDLRMR